MMEIKFLTLIDCTWRHLQVYMPGLLLPVGSSGWTELLDQHCMTETAGAATLDYTGCAWFQVFHTNDTVCPCSCQYYEIIYTWTFLQLVVEWKSTNQKADMTIIMTGEHRGRWIWMVLTDVV